MIDYFSGSLGKLKSIGGSKIYTTPHTVKVDSEYSITLPEDIKGELIANSRDGKLWFYRHEHVLYVVALKWNKTIARLEFAIFKRFDNNDDIVLACGLDWVLTNKNIFLVSDNNPYIFSSNLFDANIPDTFLYSVLRNGSVASGIDPFTNQAWGKSSDNGNSNGNGYFSKNMHLLYPAGTHSFEYCYAMLPAVGDWQIFENFLIRRPNIPLNEKYNYMLDLRPLIPLEFSSKGAAFGTGYNLNHNGIYLTCCNGKIWGRGVFHIGLVYILPAVFDANGNPLEFYLYISPDYPCSPFLSSAFNALDNWLNIAIFHIGATSLYGFLSEQANALSNSTCLTSSITEVFNPESSEWISLSSNNGKLFIDTVSSSAVVLHDKGADFRFEDLNISKAFECITLNQWIAPAGKIDAINTDYIIASDNNSTFLTSLLAGFYRQAVSSNVHFSAISFSDNKEIDYRLAIRRTFSSNVKGFDINHLLSPKLKNQNILWEDIFKPAITISVNTDQVNYYDWNIENVIKHCKYGHTNWSGNYSRLYFDDDDSELWYTDATPPIYLDRIEFDLFLLCENNNEPLGPFHIDFTLPNIIATRMRKNNTGVYVEYLSNNARVYGVRMGNISVPPSCGIYIQDDTLFIHTGEYVTDSNVEIPICSLASLGIGDSNINYSEEYSNIRFLKTLEDNRFFLFEEVQTKTIFACDISKDSNLLELSHGGIVNDVSYGYSENNPTTRFIRIVLQEENGDRIITFCIEFAPDIFNFTQEFERSKLS